MKTIKMQISGKAAEAVLNSVPRNVGLDIYTGTLLDNFVIDFGEPKKYKLGRKVCRRYLIGREVYLNEWSSGIEIIMTDSDRVYNNYIEMFDGIE